MDLYRLKNEQEALNAGVEDCLYSGNICLVEWPEKAPGIFPDDTLHITIAAAGVNARKLSFNL
jgi:tRNA threonylcarbamoyladenosine biosynthesis protein TsaE